MHVLVRHVMLYLSHNSLQVQLLAFAQGDMMLRHVSLLTCSP
jgi:hypothetical protein